MGAIKKIIPGTSFAISLPEDFLKSHKLEETYVVHNIDGEKIIVSFFPIEKI
jgi:hypothetical protein